jgi:hypothetical protein
LARDFQIKPKKEPSRGEEVKKISIEREALGEGMPHMGKEEKEMAVLSFSEVRRVKKEKKKEKKKKKETEMVCKK